MSSELMAQPSTLNPFRWSHELYRQAMEEQGSSPIQIRRAMMAAGVYATKVRMDALLDGRISPHLATAAVMAKAVGGKVDDFIVEHHAA